MPTRSQIPPSDERAEVERLLQSTLLRGSDALRRLLEYLADKSLNGQADDLKEYTVGIEAMGKPQDYDPQRDSSVRMQAARLRDKIAEFYQKEGINNPVRIDFPKGRFKLVFEKRVPAAPEPPRTMRRAPRPRLRWIAAMTALLLIAIAVSMKTGLFAGASSQSAVDAIWQPFLKTDRPVLLSLGTPLFVDVDGVGLFRAPGTDDWDAAQQQGRLRELQARFPGRPLGPSHVYTGVGEASAAFQLAKLLGARSHDLRLVTSDLLSWDEIGSSDVIFLGPPKFNLQLNEIPVKQDIVLEPFGIRNLHPQPQEPDYIQDEDAPRPIASRLATTHALISRLPGLHGEGDVLVCASNWTAGTLAAVLYLTREDTAREFVDRIRMPSGKLPQYYQAVIRATVKGYTPLEISYVFHHELRSQPAVPR